MRTKPLTGVTIESIHSAFSKAFADYAEPLERSVSELAYMIERRGYVPELSFGAFVDDELVGFTLNGVGEWNGKKTAYDTGTGVVKEFRKQGIASRIFQESLPVLKANQVSHYLLEVIRTNTGAFKLYRKAGFQVTREFDYYVSPKSEVALYPMEIKEEYQIQRTHDPDWNTYQTFWDILPSWQNSIASINRKTDRFTFLEIQTADGVIGYGVIESETGDIPQLAISKKHRRLGLGTVLVNRLLRYTSSHEIQIINVDASYQPFKQLSQHLNLSPGFGQFEMMLEL